MSRDDFRRFSPQSSRRGHEAAGQGVKPLLQQTAKSAVKNAVAGGGGKLAENVTDVATGVNPNQRIMEGVGSAAAQQAVLTGLFSTLEGALAYADHINGLRQPAPSGAGGTGGAGTGSQGGPRPGAGGAGGQTPPGMDGSAARSRLGMNPTGTVGEADVKAAYRRTASGAYGADRA